jgi:hypothetical protein
MKNTHSLASMLRHITLSLSFIFCISIQAVAQDIVYDWADKELVSSPGKVNRTQSFTVIIRNVNDILYTYRVTHTSEPLATDDLAKIIDMLKKSLPSGPAVAGAVPCPAFPAAQKQMREITEKINTNDFLPFKLRTMPKPVQSIPLDKTLGAWAAIQQEIDKLTPLINDVGKCTTLSAEERTAFDLQVTTFNALVGPIQNKVDSRHEYRDTVTLSPGNKEKFKVNEFFEGQETKDSERNFEFTPATNLLTLSGGVLFSKVPNRSYQPRKSPDSTQNVLVVEGNSPFRPEGVALLNYIIPRLDWEETGFALSAGPVVRFGSTENTSALGFFTGVSGHLYHRIYFTPGFHFGQFADFPVGFYDGRPIPENFGELNPIKRWTARFAFGISFQTASFGSKTQEVKETGKKEKETTKNSNHQAPGVSPSPNSGTLRPRTALVRSVATSFGDRLTLYADASVAGYSTASIQNTFYVVLPTTNLAFKNDVLRGNFFTDAHIDRTRDAVVLSFVLRPGTKASVTEKFNRLELNFFTSESELSFFALEK